jgi:hypothetical protein
MVISRPDRRTWAARAFAVPATILGLGDRHPWAAVVFAVPLTIVGLGGVATHPYLFVPLLVLVGVALVVIDFYGQKRVAEQQAQGAAGTQKRNRQTRAAQASSSGSCRRQLRHLAAVEVS